MKWRRVDIFKKIKISFAAWLTRERRQVAITIEYKVTAHFMILFLASGAGRAFFIKCPF
jgi:hypothetical protein